jgi:hypothetical protein
LAIEAVKTTKSWPSNVELLEVKVVWFWLAPPPSPVIVGAAPTAPAAQPASQDRT